MCRRRWGDSSTDVHSNISGFLTVHPYVVDGGGVGRGVKKICGISGRRGVGCGFGGFLGGKGGGGGRGLGGGFQLF